MVFLLTLLLPQDGGQRVPPSDEGLDGETIRIRRVYVPVDDLQKLIRGRFLPIKLDRFNEFLKSANHGSPAFSFLALDLQWQEATGLQGTGFIRPGENSSQLLQTIQTSLSLDRIETVEGLRRNLVFGTTPDGRKLIGNPTGNAFEFEVRLPDSLTVTRRRILLPDVQTCQITISIPVQYQLRCNQPLHALARVPLPRSDGLAGEETRTWIIDCQTPELILSIERRSDLPAGLLFVDNQIDVRDQRVHWSANVVPAIGTGGSMSVEFDPGFRVVAVTQGEASIPFRSYENFGGKVEIQLDQKNIPDLQQKLSFELETEISAVDSSDVSPLVIAAPKVGGMLDTRSTVTIRPGTEWSVIGTDWTGFELLSGSRQELNFLQTGVNGSIRLNLKPVTSRIKPEVVEFDYQNGMVIVRLALSDLPSESSLPWKTGWTLESVVDVSQDELPIRYKLIPNRPDPVLVLHNESPSIRVTCRRPLQQLREYHLDELVPTMLADSNPKVFFKPAFAARFRSHINTDQGMPVTYHDGIEEAFDWQDGRHLKIRVPADDDQFSVPFQSRILLTQERGKLIARYWLAWNHEINRRLIVESGLNRLQQIQFSPEGGTATQLDDAEIKSLGLVPGRQYWSFESAGLPNPAGTSWTTVRFQVDIVEKKNRALVGVPQGIGDEPSPGVMILDPLAIGNWSPVLGNVLTEVPESGNNHRRLFEFSGKNIRAIELVRQDPPAESSWYLVDSNLSIRRPGEIVQQAWVAGYSLNQESGSDSVSITSDRFEILELAVSVDGQSIPTQKNQNQWLFPLGKSRTGSRSFFLTLRYRLPAAPTPFEIPEFKINGQRFKHQGAIGFGRSVFPLSRNQVFALSGKANLRLLGWLPSIAFDSDTVDQFLSWSGWEPDDNIQLVLDGNQDVLVIPVEWISVVGLALFVASMIAAYHLPRLRHVVAGCIFFAILVFVLGNVYSLIASFLFWGFGGAVLCREIRMLTQPDRRQVTVASVLLFLVLGSGNSLQAQEKKTVRNTDSNQRVTPAIIPVDKQGKPSGIVYLEADVYEKLQATREIGDTILIRGSRLEILSNSTTQQLFFAVRLNCRVLKSGRLRIPFHVQDAIYETDAVTFNSKVISSQPLDSIRQIEVDLPQTGQASIQITFSVPRGSREQINIYGPFAARTSVVNRTGDNFGVLKTGDPVQNFRVLSPNTVAEYEAPGSLSVLVNPKKHTASLVELWTLNPAGFEGSLLLVPDSPLSQPVKIRVLDQRVPLDSKLIQPSDENRLVVNADNESHVRVDFKWPRTPDAGRFTLHKPIVDGFQINFHAVLINVGEQTAQWTHRSELLDTDGIDQAIDLWNQADPDQQLVSTEIEVAANLSTVDQLDLWGVPKRAVISGQGIHDFLLMADHIRIETLLTVDTSGPAKNLLLTFPSVLNLVDVRFGDKPLYWVAQGSDRVLINCGIDLPGRYEFKLVSLLPVQNNRFRFPAPVLNAEAYSSVSRFWSSHQRVLVNANLDPEPNSTFRNRFNLDGSLPGTGHLLTTTTSTGLPEVNCTESISFLPGSTRHLVSIKSSVGPENRWIGIDLPFDARLAGDPSTRERWTRRKSEAFGKLQLWIPMSTRNPGDLQIEYEVPLSGNRVTFARIVNAESVTRTINLPQMLDQDTIGWQLNNSKVTNSDRSRLTAIDAGDSSGASYEIQEMRTNRLNVLLAEYRLTAPHNVLKARFYVDPGGKSELRFKLPEGYWLLNAKVYGQGRSWTNVNQIASIPLLNSRLLQIVDVSFHLTIDNQSPIRLDLPLVDDDDGYHTFFQADRLWSCEMPRKPSSQLLQERKRIIEQVIRNYDVNSGSPIAWQKILQSFLEEPFLKQIPGVAETEIRARLDNLLALESELPEFPGLNRQPVPNDSRQDPDSQPRIPTTLARHNTGILPPVCLIEDDVFIPNNHVPNKSDSHDGKKPSSRTSKVLLRSVVHKQELSIGNLRWLGIPIAILVLFALALRIPTLIRGSLFSLTLAISVWIAGVTWVSLTPRSILAWCWILFALLFALLVLIDLILTIRVHQKKTTPMASDSASRSGHLSTTQMADTQSNG